MDFLIQQHTLFYLRFLIPNLGQGLELHSRLKQCGKQRIYVFRKLFQTLKNENVWNIYLYILNHLTTV